MSACTSDCGDICCAHCWDVAHLRAEVEAAAKDMAEQLDDSERIIAALVRERDDLRAEVARLTKERDGWQRAAESQNRQWARKCEEVTEARAEVERLKLAGHAGTSCAMLAGRLVAAEAEVKRLRGLIAEAIGQLGAEFPDPAHAFAVLCEARSEARR